MTTTEDELIVELANVPSRIDAFLDVISNFEIVEMSRSGVTAIRKIISFRLIGGSGRRLINLFTQFTFHTFRR